MKNLLSIVSGNDSDIGLISTSIDIAQKYKSHLTFLNISPSLSSYIGFYGEGVTVSAEISNIIERENKHRRDKIIKSINESAKSKSIAVLGNKSLAKPNEASISFLGIDRGVEEAISAESKFNDMIISPKSSDSQNSANDEIILAAIFNSSRPLLILPSQVGNWSNKVVSVAWNGSRESARAIYGSMRILKIADSVKILIGNGDKKNNHQNDNEKLLLYFKMHEVNAEIVAVEHKQNNIADDILKKAEALYSDLLIMGAYGHSRFRETILGGFTQYMLQQADIPLQLSH